MVPVDDPDVGPSDDELMAAMAGGDRNALALLVRRHRDRAWAVAWRYAGDSDLAQDLVQETFLKVFESASRYRRGGRFRAWMYRVLVNRALNLRRDRSRIAPVEVPEPACASTPGDAYEAACRDRLVDRALSSLPPNQRIALVLRYFEGQSYLEIAESMDISVKAVERLIARGREALRERLAPLI